MFARIIKDSATPLLEKLMRGLTTSEQMRTLLQWGAMVRKKAQENAIEKGGRRFWRDIARSTNVREVSASSVQVASDHVAAAQKQYGGTIAAPGKQSEHPAQALTIPFPGSIAEGHRASEFGQDLFILKSKKGKAILGFAQDKKFVPLFILTKSVSQRASPWFPSDQEAASFGEALATRRLGLA